MGWCTVGCKGEGERSNVEVRILPLFLPKYDVHYRTWNPYKSLPYAQLGVPFTKMKDLVMLATRDYEPG